MGKIKNTYKILVIKAEEKRLHGRYRQRLEVNIKIDLKGIGLWTTSAWLRVWSIGRSCNTIMNLKFPQ
jgi:hypothetical protein